MRFSEIEEEHIYIICENLPEEKNFLYSKIYRDILVNYGKSGIEFLEILFELNKQYQKKERLKSGVNEKEYQKTEIKKKIIKLKQKLMECEI